MNNYDDPRWYEQHPEHNDVPAQSVQQPSSFAPNVQQPPNSEYSSYPPYTRYQANSSRKYIRRIHHEPLSEIEDDGALALGKQS